MKFDDNGFPYPSGATDKMDSAHLAGLMAFVGHEKMTRDKLLEYCEMNEDNEFVLRRCPNDRTDLDPGNYKNCTRDQLIPYMAGLLAKDLPVAAIYLKGAAERRGWRAQNTEKDIPGSTKKFPDGADILDPSHIGYMRICAGLEATWFQRLWMKAKIIIDSTFFPMSEPNNIIVMSIIYGYADMLKKWNPEIYRAISEYWTGWRNEPELAKMLITKLRNS